MLISLHESHQELYRSVKTKKLTKQHVYWLGITSDIYNVIVACRVSNIYARSNKKTVLMNHEIPDLPFNKVGVDITYYNGNDY